VGKWEKKPPRYNKRVWLNPEDSASSGSLICFDGFVVNFFKSDIFKL